MADGRWNSAGQLFQACLDQPPVLRPRFLEEACGTDEPLRREVEALLAAHDEASSFPEPHPHRTATIQRSAAVVLETAEVTGVASARDDSAGELLAETGRALSPGTRLGPYEVVALLGAGGMGEVYRARDTRLGREVAVKVLPPELAANAERVRRFEHEARAASSLKHPAIVTVYDVGKLGSAFFIVMELVEGRTLRDLLQGGALPLPQMLAIATQLAAGLAKAHAAGIVHRDLKPENVVVTDDGFVKILDFGLAKLQPGLGGEGSGPTHTVLSRTGVIMGTVGYMSPEQARGERVDFRSDQFALGTMLYEMGTGQAPFRRPSVAEGLAAILSEQPPAMSRLNPAVPPALLAVVERCLAKRAADRYASTSDLQHEMEALGKTATTEVAVGRVTGAIRGRRRILWPAAAAVLVVAALAFVAERSGWRQRLFGGPRIGSIAVLPLENLSGDPAQDYFADGMTMALISDLARIPDLRVIARPSVMRYKGKKKPVPEIARELNVEAVVAASVQRVGGRVQIAARLLEAATDRQLWAQNYERDQRDILALQGEVSRAIAQGIHATLTPQQEARLREPRPVEPQTYEAFLKGFFHCSRPGGQPQGIELLEATIGRDPSYAPAYATLAICYHDTAFFLGTVAPKEAYGRAKAAASEALKLDPDLPEAHAALAQAKLHYDWDFAGAERALGRALELKPSDAASHHWYAHYLLAMGRAEESMAATRRSLELNPMNAGLAACVGWHCFLARQYDQAIESTRKALELDPKNYMAHYYLGWAYEKKADFAPAIAELETAIGIIKRPSGLASLARVYARAGKRAEAEKVLAELVAMSKKGYVPAYDLAVAHGGMGDRDQAFDWLEKAYQERSAMLVHVNWDPRFEELRADPRFPALVRRIGLPT